MTTQFQNTLYVTTQGTILRKDGETISAFVDGERVIRVPLHHLGSVVVFGRVTVTPSLIAFLAERGVSLIYMSETGRFLARLIGPRSGNVLLRMDQFVAAREEEKALAIARSIVRGKIANARWSVMRSRRDRGAKPDALLDRTMDALAALRSPLERAENTNAVRGIEGNAARLYFACFPAMIRIDDPAFSWNGRSRRPPRDPINALLSFLYALLLGDTTSAAESVGLDAQVGFLHSLRPGRPSLGLDLQEELRPVLADRLALTLINRRQIDAGSFQERAGGSWTLSEDGRRTVLVAYQARKQTEINHELLKNLMPLGFVPMIQARLLARHLRGDLPTYPPFAYR